MIRRAAVGAAVLAGLLLFSPAASPAAPIVVRPGGTFPVRSAGFAPHARVELLLVPPGTVRYVRADGHGVVKLRYRAPTTPGHYTLYIVGPIPVGRLHRPPGHGPGDHQYLKVMVPLVDPIDIVVRIPGHGTGSGHGHKPGGPAGTGFPVAQWLVIAVVSIAGGTILLIIATRRGRPDRGELSAPEHT